MSKTNLAAYARPLLSGGGFLIKKVRYIMAISYDPQSTARDVLQVLRNHNTPLILVDAVFEKTHELIRQETLLVNTQSDSAQPLSQRT